MAAPAVQSDLRDPVAGRRSPSYPAHRAATPAPTPVPVPAVGGCQELASQPVVDREQIRATAYAAVTAHLNRDDDQVARLVHELLQEPVDAASALLALIQACRGLAERWGHDVGQEPLHLWASQLAASGCCRPAPEPMISPATVR